ncbi:magnesium and cobalt transport protein CorA, partial [candidate division KSB1 bacterium]|nr:magnesium and cobalt transport protein CorA [candidate division KSB1 bacterium]
MSKSKKRRGKRPGLPPGTLVHVGEQKIERIKVSLIDYEPAKFQEQEITEVQECFPFRDRPTVTWINIDGLHNLDAIEKIG